MGWVDTMIAYVFLAFLLVCLGLTIWSIVAIKGPEKPAGKEQQGGFTRSAGIVSPP